MNTRKQSSRGDVVVVSGYDVRIRVERGHVVIEDGIADERRRIRLARVDRHVRRVVVFGQSGMISLEAVRWLHDIGIALAHISSDGSLLMTSTRGALDDPRLRRAQALATTNESGLAIARQLIRLKVEAQAQLAVELAPAAATLDDMHALFPEVEHAKSGDLMIVEAAVANLYWRQWKSVNVRFAQRDQKRIPKHWRTFGSRQSVLSRSHRRAANPANAILNYLYTILEAEARIACRTMGLDPGLGVLHSDQPARDSLAFDVMEPVRPAVDAYVLSLLTKRTFTRADFFETRDGNCRILPPVAQVLAETGPRWGQLLAPIVEDVAKRLLESSSQGSSSRTGRLPTPLTERHRRAGRDRYRKQPAPAVRRMPNVQHTCSVCGEPLPAGRNEYCVECWNDRKQKAAAKTQAATRRRSERTEARKVKLESAPSRRSPSADQFVFNILPRLQRIPAKEIAEATGLSAPYCALIKQGHRIPHPRHWPTFSEMVRARVR